MQNYYPDMKNIEPKTLFQTVILSVIINTDKICAK
jgi:hypothetical protein